MSTTSSQQSEKRSRTVFKVGAPQLIVKSVTMRRGQRNLFEPVSFTATPNQLIHLTGENGQGKSTFLKGLSGVLPMASGNALLQLDSNDNESALALDTLPLAFKHTRLIWLSSDVICQEGLTTSAYLKQQLILRRGPMTSSALSKALSDLFTQGEISLDWYDVPLEKLSSGQQQRVKLTSLLSADQGQVWLLDEPFVYLDAHWRAKWQQWVSQLKGVVVLSHHGAVQSANRAVKSVRLTSSVGEAYESD